MKKLKIRPLTLKFAWDTRLDLLNEGNKLLDEGDKLRAECEMLRIEVNKRLSERRIIRIDGEILNNDCLKLLATGNKLKAKGDQLAAECQIIHCEANKIWFEAIRKVYGNIYVEWKNESCHLETGEVFKP